MGGWLYASWFGAVAVLLPITYVVSSLLRPANENWSHIQQYLLKNYFFQTAVLVLFTSLFTLILGVTLAWLVAAYDFPLKRFWRWALILPLAVPPYIAAYTYSHMLSYTGFVQTTLRSQFGITPDPRWFDVMSVRGAVLIFTFFLYPYVYLITRSYLERQCASFIESGRLLGRTPLSIFFRIVLPVARPAIAGGVMLVAFEVLSDYGLAKHFGLQTIATAIFQTWFGMYDVDSAMRLAAWLMLAVVGLFLLERLLRGRRRFSSSTSKTRPLAARRLNGWKGGAALFYCLSVFAFSFLIPVAQLIVWAGWTYRDILTPAFLQLSANTLSVAFIATVLIMVLAVVVANVSRMERSWHGYVLAKSVTAGYSIPGPVIAIGVLSLFLFLDGLFAPLYQKWGLGDMPLVLSMSLIMLIAGYVVRFTATGYNAVEAGLSRVGLKYMEASRLLGLGMTKTFLKVDIHLIRRALLSGFILTFVEIVKELPLALLLKPFNFETLATKVYQYANDEQIIEASIPSLFIVFVSMATVYLMHQLGKKRA